MSNNDCAIPPPPPLPLVPEHILPRRQGDSVDAAEPPPDGHRDDDLAHAIAGVRLQPVVQAAEPPVAESRGNELMWAVRRRGRARADDRLREHAATVQRLAAALQDVSHEALEDARAVLEEARDLESNVLGGLPDFLESHDWPKDRLHYLLGLLERHDRLELMLAPNLRGERGARSLVKPLQAAITAALHVPVAACDLAACNKHNLRLPTDYELRAVVLCRRLMKLLWTQMMDRYNKIPTCTTKYSMSYQVKTCFADFQTYIRFCAELDDALSQVRVDRGRVDPAVLEPFRGHASCAQAKQLAERLHQEYGAGTRNLRCSPMGCAAAVGASPAVAPSTPSPREVSLARAMRRSLRGSAPSLPEAFALVADGVVAGVRRHVAQRKMHPRNGWLCEPHPQHRMGHSLVHVAALRGRLHVLRLLLEPLTRHQVVRVCTLADAHGNTPLHLAAMGGHIGCLKALIAAWKATRSALPPPPAAAVGAPLPVDTPLPVPSTGLPPPPPPLATAQLPAPPAAGGGSAACPFTATNAKGQTPCHLCLSGGGDAVPMATKVGMLRALVDAGAPLWQAQPDAFGNTPLSLASRALLGQPVVELPPALAQGRVVDFSPYLESPQLADVTFELSGGERVHAHRIVLCVQSEAFKHMLCGPWTEGQSRVVPLPDVDVAVFRDLLAFAYTGQCNVRFNREEHALQLLQLADRYLFPSLKAVLAHTLFRQLSVTNAFIVYQVAAQVSDCRQLARAAAAVVVNHYDEFAPYDTDADMLWTILTTAASEKRT